MNDDLGAKFIIGLVLFMATPGMMAFAPAIDAMTATTLETGSGSAEPALQLLPFLWRVIALGPWALGALSSSGSDRDRR